MYLHFMTFWNSQLFFFNGLDLNGTYVRFQITVIMSNSSGACNHNVPTIHENMASSLNPKK
jgi:hypothetical protein